MLHKHLVDNSLLTLEWVHIQLRPEEAAQEAVCNQGDGQIVLYNLAYHNCVVQSGDF